MARRRDLEYGARQIRELLVALERPDELAQAYAEAILAQARRNAAGRPTPQAPMAARNMIVTDATIHPRAGGAPADVALGSEFGSTLYPQFHKRPSRTGYWLYPAAEAVGVLAETEDALEAVLERVTRGA